jgi:hypothetical protein
VGSKQDLPDAMDLPKQPSTGFGFDRPIELLEFPMSQWRGYRGLPVFIHSSSLASRKFSNRLRFIAACHRDLATDKPIQTAGGARWKLFIFNPVNNAEQLSAATLFTEPVRLPIG